MRPVVVRLPVLDLGRLLLGEIPVGREPLDRVEASLEHRPRGHSRFEEQRDIERLGQRQRRERHRHQVAPRDGQDGSQEDNTGTEDVQSHSEPFPGHLEGEVGAVIGVDLVVGGQGEGRLQPVRPDGLDAGERLGEVRVYWRPGYGIQSLHLDERAPVVLLHDVVDAHDRHDARQQDGLDDGQEDESRQQLHDAVSKLAHRHGQQKVHVVRVLGEPVEDPPDWGDVEEEDRRAHEAGQRLPVDHLRRVQGRKKVHQRARGRQRDESERKAEIAADVGIAVEALAGRHVVHLRLRPLRQVPVGQHPDGLFRAPEEDEREERHHAVGLDVVQVDLSGDLPHLLVLLDHELTLAVVGLLVIGLLVLDAHGLEPGDAAALPWTAVAALAVGRLDALERLLPGDAALDGCELVAAGRHALNGLGEHPR